MKNSVRYDLNMEIWKINKIEFRKPDIKEYLLHILD